VENRHRLRRNISESIRVKQLLLGDESLLARMAAVVDCLVAALSSGHRVLLAGNGGSAADAQHFAAELVGRFAFDRPGLPALSLTTDTSMLTAIANDYGYEQVFARQLQAQARAGDVFIGLTTSGTSPNMLAAFDACLALGVRSVALCGMGGDFKGRVDHLLRMPSLDTPRIQECHGLIGHLLCAEVELQLFGELRRRSA
jgi:D-sedoheptulose 7-phosphate isomerase